MTHSRLRTALASSSRTIIARIVKRCVQPRQTAESISHNQRTSNNATQTSQMQRCAPYTTNTCNIEHATYCAGHVQPATCSVQRAKLNMRHTTSNMHGTPHHADRRIPRAHCAGGASPTWSEWAHNCDRCWCWQVEGIWALEYSRQCWCWQAEGGVRGGAA